MVCEKELFEEQAESSFKYSFVFHPHASDS